MNIPRAASIAIAAVLLILVLFGGIALWVNNPGFYAVPTNFFWDGFWYLVKIVVIVALIWFLFWALFSTRVVTWLLILLLVVLLLPFVGSFLSTLYVGARVKAHGEIGTSQNAVSDCKQEDWEAGRRPPSEKCSKDDLQRYIAWDKEHPEDGSPSPEPTGSCTQQDWEAGRRPPAEDCSKEDFVRYVAWDKEHPENGSPSPDPTAQSTTPTAPQSTPTAPQSTPQSTPAPTSSGTASCSAVPGATDKTLGVLVDPSTDGTPDKLRGLKENGADLVIMDHDPGDPEAWLRDAQCIGLEGGASYDGAFESGDDAARQFAQRIANHPNNKVALINYNLTGEPDKPSISETNGRIALLKDATGGKDVCVQVNLDYPKASQQVDYLNKFDTECVIVSVFPYSNFNGSTMEALSKVAGPVKQANPSAEVTVGVQAFESSGKKPTPDQVGEMVNKYQSGGDVDNALVITEGENTIEDLPAAVKQADVALAS